MPTCWPSARPDTDTAALAVRTGEDGRIGRSGPLHARAARFRGTGMTGGTSERLRAICLALPEAVEKETWGAPTFRVRGRIFAIQRQGTGRTSVWFKAPPGSQAVSVGADPDRFFAPPYLGPEGWVAMHLDRSEEHTSELQSTMRNSYAVFL